MVLESSFTLWIVTMSMDKVILLASFGLKNEHKGKAAGIIIEKLTQKFVCAGRSNCVITSDKLDAYIALKPIQERIKDIMILYKSNS